MESTSIIHRVWVEHLPRTPRNTTPQHPTPRQSSVPVVAPKRPLPKKKVPFTTRNDVGWFLRIMTEGYRAVSQVLIHSMMRQMPGVILPDERRLLLEKKTGAKEDAGLVPWTRRLPWQTRTIARIRIQLLPWLQAVVKSESAACRMLVLRLAKKMEHQSPKKERKRRKRKRGEIRKPRNLSKKTPRRQIPGVP